MKKYPSCSCGCQIGLKEINGLYLCHNCMKEFRKCINIVNYMLRNEKVKNNI